MAPSPWKNRWRHLAGRMPWAQQLYRKLRPKAPFRDSASYWEGRYREGGTSGAGSYGQLAAFKAEVINAFIARHQIRTVIELGCGDGNQARLFDVETYWGYDVSAAAIARCRERCHGDPRKHFLRLPPFPLEAKAELTLSLDVIYHLVEDQVYHDHLQSLFAASSRFVIIYSTNRYEAYQEGSHERHRKFTDWIDQHAPDFERLQHIPNKYPYDGNPWESSVSDFYIWGATHSPAP